MATMDVKDAGGATVAVEKPNANGRQVAAGSRPVALSTEDLAALQDIATKVEALKGYTDGLEGLVTTLNGYIDGLETLIGSSNTLITAQSGYVDGLEALMTTLNGYVDGLEGLTGGLTETAPATDTASSGLNGRLQRIAQRLTALLPAALTGNGGLKTGLVEALPAGTNAIGKVLIDADLTAGEYETVAATQTDQVIGATGAIGDYLAGLLIVPATTSPGAVSIKDGAGSAITVFTGGSSSVSNLVPFYVPLGLKSASGAWKVTTGANVSVVASGNFT